MLSTYGVKIRTRLTELGMTQKELAQKIGISEENLSIILNGRRGGWKHREKIEYILENTKNKRLMKYNNILYRKEEMN